MIWDFAFRKLAKVIEWYKRIILLLTTKYWEHVGFNEL